MRFNLVLLSLSIVTKNCVVVIATTTSTSSSRENADNHQQSGAQHSNIRDSFQAVRKLEGLVASGSSRHRVRELAQHIDANDEPGISFPTKFDELGYVPFMKNDQQIKADGDDEEDGIDEDEAIDLAVNASGIPDPLLSFEGLGQIENILVSGGAVSPADPVGDVGPNHYVQMTNIAFAIWDKKGKLLIPPTRLGALWEGFEVEDCSLDNGDPIVLYDQLEDRWLLSQFTTACRNPGGTCYNCVALSKTGDPLGEYSLYAFPAQEDPDDSTTSVLPDYPKYGVWSDSYILTTRDFGVASFGVSVYALEKSKMLAGDPNPGVVQFSEDFFGPNGGQIGDGIHILPPDIDGDALPPPGTPAPLIAQQDDDAGADFDGLNIWELMVDWDNSDDATFILKESIEVAAYSIFLCADLARDCIEQPLLGPSLDALTQLMMHRFAYRNFGCLESMVVSEAVRARENKAGMRWYEIRRVDGDYSIHQQSTFSPDDGKNRWMGSIAQDGAGNIAMGYSVTDPNDILAGYPGIQYTGRLLDDPINQMTLGEAVLAYGAAPIIESNRWGDYSSLNIDPVDDCTFWYTNLYIPSVQNVAGFPLWNTRIGSFSLPGCDNREKKIGGKKGSTHDRKNSAVCKSAKGGKKGSGKGGKKGEPKLKMKADPKKPLTLRRLKGAS